MIVSIKHAITRNEAPMKLLAPGVLLAAFLFAYAGRASKSPESPSNKTALFGFRNSAQETSLESRFLAIPDPKLAEEHLRVLTQAPHVGILTCKGGDEAWALATWRSLRQNV